MDIDNKVLGFLKKNKDLINYGGFEELFDEAANNWGSYSYEINQLYEIIRLADIDPNLENNIPSMLRVYKQVIGAGATFLGWDYNLNTGGDKDTEWYKQHEGKHGKFVGLSIPADYSTKKSSLNSSFDDYDNYTDSFWDFEFDDGSLINTIMGSTFRLDKPLK